MKKILIIPDIKGWATDTMAKEIQKSFNNIFDIDVKYNKLIEDPDINKYDKIYYMISGDIPDGLSDYSKIITTFHGGPGNEGQADSLNKKKWRNEIKVSYVSNQTKDRVKSYGFNNEMFFTPHGVKKQGKVSETLNTKKLRCGWAGWVQYLMNKQANHRRGYWIMKSQQDITYNLYVAGGHPDYDNHVEFFKQLFPNIKVDLYKAEEMINFYNSINAYLIPDRFAGGPMPALEAGSFGIPLITTNCGLCGDIMVDKGFGILVSSYSQFVDAINFMDKNDKERFRMGLNFKEWVENNRTWDKVSHYWCDFFGGE